MWLNATENHNNNVCVAVTVPLLCLLLLQTGEYFGGSVAVDDFDGDG